VIRPGNVVLPEEVDIFITGSEQILKAASSEAKINELLGPK
jgi:hypothetical protein